MGISSPNVVQGKENPLVASLKYANDAIKQSFQLMQNAKELGLKEKELNYNKNLALLNNVQRNYELRAAEIGPMAAFAEARPVLGAVYSALGMEDAAIQDLFRNHANAPYAYLDLDNATLNAFAEGGSLKPVGPTTYKTVMQEQDKIVEEAVAGRGEVTVDAMVDADGQPKPPTSNDVHMAELYKIWKGLVDHGMAGKPAKNEEGKYTIEYNRVTAGVYGDFARRFDNYANRNNLTTQQRAALWAQVRGLASPIAPDAFSAQVLGVAAVLGGAATSGLGLQDKSAGAPKGWAAGEDIPRDFTPASKSTPSPVDTQAAKDNRYLAYDAPTGQAGARTEAVQNQIRVKNEEIREGAKFTSIAEGEKAADKVKKTLVFDSTGPAPGQNIEEFKGLRTKYWTGKEIMGTTIDAAMAKHLADMEALIPPTTTTKTIKANVPVIVAEEPPLKFVSGGAKNSVVPPYAEPDSVSNGPAWKGAKSFYEWWAKRQAGVEFGKGDEARMSNNLKAYVNALPADGRARMTEDVINNYLTFLGEGDPKKGASRVVYANNTAAINAETARMGEERLAQKAFTATRDIEFMGLSIKKGDKVTDTTAQVMIMAAQAAVENAKVSMAGQWMNGDLIAKSYAASEKAMLELAADISKTYKGDEKKMLDEWNARIKLPPYADSYIMYQNSFNAMWSFVDKDGTFLGDLDMEQPELIRRWIFGKATTPPALPVDPKAPPGTYPASPNTAGRGREGAPLNVSQQAALDRAMGNGD